MMQHTQVLGIRVDGYTFETWLAQIGAWIQQGDKLYHICTLNPEFVIIAQHHPDFFRVLNQSDACVADGVGVLFASRFIRPALPARVTGSDGIYKIAERGAQQGWKIFLLGAAPTIAQQAADKLCALYPTAQIVGTSSANPNEADQIIPQINASLADILLVAYGAPLQDLWIEQYRDQLKVKVAMGVGGAFDFVAGIVPRAPQWMKRTGIEWLFRLYKQPWRWRRMLRLPLFVWYVLIYRSKPIPRARNYPSEG
jgi:N-acetylglucosaminyldiphosphoundecaprenol N-acetyl-beta-D-mannosaminyltransferase